jgi:integrase/recombinase XerD
MKSYLEPSQIVILEDAATNLRDKLLIRILFHLGCRISEALPLAVDHIDFQNGTITIRHLKYRVRIECSYCHTRLGRKSEFCPGCGRQVTEAIKREQEHHRKRVLPVDQETLSMIKEFISRGGPVTKDGKQLFFGINRHRAWQIITMCAKRASLPKLVNPETGKTHYVSPHKLRDAFAVNALKTDDSGEGQRFLQEHLGHQSFNTTAKYRKITGEEQREWYDKLWEKGTP